MIHSTKSIFLSTILAVAAATIFVTSALQQQQAFADESETETEQNDEDEVIQSGFLNTLTVQKCKALASGACPAMTVDNTP